MKNKTLKKTHCGICFQVLGDHKVDFSLILSFPQVEDPGMVFWIIWSKEPCQQWQTHQHCAVKSCEAASAHIHLD